MLSFPKAPELPTVELKQQWSIEPRSPKQPERAGHATCPSDPTALLLPSLAESSQLLQLSDAQRLTLGVLSLLQ